MMCYSIHGVESPGEQLLLSELLILVQTISGRMWDERFIEHEVYPVLISPLKRPSWWSLTAASNKYAC